MSLIPELFDLTSAKPVGQMQSCYLTPLNDMHPSFCKGGGHLFYPNTTSAGVWGIRGEVSWKAGDFAGSRTLSLQLLF